MTARNWSLDSGEYWPDGSVSAPTDNSSDPEPETCVIKDGFVLRARGCKKAGRTESLTVQS